MEFMNERMRECILNHEMSNCYILKRDILNFNSENLSLKHLNLYKLVEIVLKQNISFI